MVHDNILCTVESCTWFNNGMCDAVSMIEIDLSENQMVAYCRTYESRGSDERDVSQMKVYVVLEYGWEYQEIQKIYKKKEDAEKKLAEYQTEANQHEHYAIEEHELL